MSRPPPGGYPFHPPNPMRSLLLTAGLVLAMAVPAQAQISFSPVVGYDLEADGPSIGLAFEVGGPLQSIPLAPSIRPLIEYVFIDAPTGADFTFIRGNVDLIGRLALGAQSQFAPYAKAGVSIEYFDSGVDVQGLTAPTPTSRSTSARAQRSRTSSVRPSWASVASTESACASATGSRGSVLDSSRPAPT